MTITNKNGLTLTLDERATKELTEWISTQEEILRDVGDEGDAFVVGLLNMIVTHLS